MEPPAMRDKLLLTTPATAFQCKSMYFLRQISRSWRKWPAAGIRFSSSNWFEPRILYTRAYTCRVEDQFIAKEWFSNRMEFVIFYRSNFSLSSLNQQLYFFIIFKIVIATISQDKCSFNYLRIQRNNRNCLKNYIGPRFWKKPGHWNWKIWKDEFLISRPLSTQRSAKMYIARAYVFDFSLAWWISLFSSWFFGPLSQWGTKIAH